MSLLERFPGAPAAWHDTFPQTSRYTFGLAGERFFRAIKDEGKILGTRCPDCERTYVPAAIFCERCMMELTEWVDVGTTGRIHTFTFLFQNYDGSDREVPEAIAFVRMDDGGLVHRLGEVDPSDVHIGLPVEAVFKPKAEREGSIHDIRYFRPVKAK